MGAHFFGCPILGIGCGEYLRRPASLRRVLTWLSLAAVAGSNPLAAAPAPTQVTYSNNDLILLPEFDDGPGSIYPSLISVSGQTAAVSKVTVTLLNVNHVYPDDLDIILVGPGGRKTYLMSDAGLDVGLNNVTLTFDDAAAQPVPDTGPIVSGTYRPANYGTLADMFAEPAPPGPYATNLSVFNGTNPNGLWSLYVMDDLPNDTGYLEGWRLNLTLGDPLADVAVTLSDAPDPVANGGILVYTATVTNLGPGAASGIMLTNRLPALAQLVSVTTSQGSCSTTLEATVCSLGTLPKNAQAVVRLELLPMKATTMTNWAQVSALELDLNPGNNTASATTTVIRSANLGLTHFEPIETVPFGQDLVYTLAVTNRGPDAASNLRLTNGLDAGLTFLSVVSSQGSCSNVAGTVLCSLGTLEPGAGALVTIATRATSMQSATNTAWVVADEPDLDPSDNQSSFVTAILPVNDLAVALTGLPRSGPVGNTLTYTIWLTNQGPSLARDLFFLNSVGTETAFVSAESSQGTCLGSDGAVICALEPLPAGQVARVDLTVVPGRPGTLTNQVQVFGAGYDPDSANNLSIQTIEVFQPFNSFSNANPVQIAPSGPADPFPSTIEVGGIPAEVFKVTVTLESLSHPIANELEILLVGPDGQASWLMAAAGGATAVSNLTLCFDPESSRRVPKSGPLESGVYAPARYGLPGLGLPAPAPPGPYEADLDVFKGTNPNGFWSLYVYDLQPGNAGSLGDGWSLTVATLAFDPVPPEFTALELTSGGSVRLRFRGTRGQTYVVQASTNLEDWTDLEAAAESGPGVFTFEDRPAEPRRFYRARTP
jgi:uncharacterized repeat protein (TIGR01451 family)